jgi:hypothetical protein
MRKIALALILFQLIGCAKQPAIVTNQTEINRLKHESERNQEESIFWNVAAVVMCGIFAICSAIFIDEIKKMTQSKIDLEKKVEEAEKKVATMKDEQAKFKQDERGLKADIIILKESQAKLLKDNRSLKHEARKLKVTQPQQQRELNDLKTQQHLLKYEVKKLKTRQNTAPNEDAPEEDVNDN